MVKIWGKKLGGHYLNIFGMLHDVPAVLVCIGVISAVVVMILEVSSSLQDAVVTLPLLVTTLSLLSSAFVCDSENIHNQNNNLMGKS